jgi:hypothetical protein
MEATPRTSRGTFKNHRRLRRPIPRHVALQDPGLSQKYYTRKHSSRISTNDVRDLFCIFLNEPTVFCNCAAAGR